ncbi:DUF4843 domain-containing protein [Chitinophaga lutea]
MKQLRYILLFLIPAMQFACSKSELQAFDAPDMVYVYKPRLGKTNDSITYSFAVRADDLQFDTVRIPLRIMGQPAGKDRNVKYSVMVDQSSYSNANFELLPAFIRANSFTGELLVKVTRSTDLKTKEMRLWLRLETSEDLKTGVDDQLTYLVKLNDFLSMPASWNAPKFGVYSNVKYDLIIKATGEYDYSAIEATELTYLKQVAVNYLLAWEAANGPLLDENGQRVYFP